MDDAQPTRYMRCRRCGTVYASPRAARADRWSNLEEDYAVGEFADRIARGRELALAAVAALVQSYVPGGTVLDVGCDLGHFFQHFPVPAWTRCGAELSPSAAHAAAETYGADVRVGDLTQAGFAAGSVDVVTMLDMFYYVEDPLAELTEVRRVLRRGGYVVIDYPGQAWLFARSRGPLCWLCERRWTRLRTNSPYVSWLTPAAMRTLVLDAGFRVAGVHVLGSPTSGRPLRDGASRAHRAVLDALVRVSGSFLTWAPKYLLVAQVTQE